ncbi:MAG: hypothetical protein NTX88_09820 [Candidatus Atribacteria bacterium]|nr:hypothetical protein [Candidatus Atribacteria bacterium]
MPLGNAKTLKKVFDLLCPFEKDGTLKSEENRKALLASNANIPLDVEMKGFVMASCTGGGSPQLVQISYNTAKDTGNDLKKIKAPEGVKRNPLAIRPAAIGAKRCADMLNWLTDDFDAQLVFMTLDHFSSPKFDFNACRGCQGSGGVNRYEAKARIEEAIEVMKPIFGKEVEINQETIDAYVNYMAGDGLGAFRKDFIGAVMLGNPAAAEKKGIKNSPEQRWKTLKTGWYFS